MLEFFHGPRRELRGQLEQKRSFRDGPDEQFLPAIRKFKANWQPAA